MLNCSHRYTSNIILGDCSHRYTSNIILDDYSWLFKIIRNIFLSWYQNLFLNFQEFENLKMTQVLAKSCSFISLPSDSLLLFYFSSIWLFVALLFLFHLTLCCFFISLPSDSLLLFYFSSVWLFVALLFLFRLTLCCSFMSLPSDSLQFQKQFMTKSKTRLGFKT